MSRAVTCPVCNGSGRHVDKTCHGCYGSGWVEIEKRSVNRAPEYSWPERKWII